MEQVQGLWKVKNQNMSDLFEEAKKLKDQFLSFQINHVLRVGTVDFFLVLMLYGSSYGPFMIDFVNRIQWNLIITSLTTNGIII